MKTYHFRLLNVFAETRFSGNPLCVFEDAQGLSETQMQMLAQQFNLSETSFILPSDSASARMRIFTTSQELPFAGHPSLGTAAVVKEVKQTTDSITLECRAGLVNLQARADFWDLKTAEIGGIRRRPLDADVDVAKLLGLNQADLLSPAQWLDTGSEQLLVPLKTAEAVRLAKPQSALNAHWPTNNLGRKLAYVFAFENEYADAEQPVQVLCRYFYANAAGNWLEDPGTGSACANLGGWWISANHPLPAKLIVSQGAQTGRPCQLHLDVDSNAEIRVGGRVVEIGRGSIQIE